MNQETDEYYSLLSDLCPPDSKTNRKTAYRRLRELTDTLCRTLLTDDGLQMTDLAARINFASARLNLNIREQNRLHTARLTANAVLSKETEATDEMLLRDIKTVAFFIRRLTGQNIPGHLRQKLPKADATYIVRPPSAGRTKRMRVSFERKDGQFLYVWPTSGVSDTALRVRYNVPQINEEFNATCDILWPHAQLNLLDVDIDKEGTLTPAFIVLEPDYLTDISTLAECFKEYGHHPGNYVLGQLQPIQRTMPLMLGNIANLFLDEWIHARPEEEPDYLECMRKAFREYALPLAACDELADRKLEQEFFADCKKHFDNIRLTVLKTFTTPGYGLDRTDAVLEPTYLCEALGLQGRLDYMQRDRSAFIEMKSGKADEYTLRGKIEPRENNRVQMLLYQAMLQYVLGTDHRQVKAYLLYTRYPLLYPARPSWAMVKRVTDVRNRIVANEHNLQRHNDPAYTEQWLRKTLDPEELNQRQLDNKLWREYLRPGIAQTARQFARLTALERTYFCAVYNFITKEIYTAKSGDCDYNGNRGAASLWLATPDEKREAGEIIHHLTITANHAAEEHKPWLQLERSGDIPDTDSGTPDLQPNFRPGDAVILYERNAETDNVTNRQLFKGNIEDISGKSIRIRLRMTQQNASVLPPDSLYAVEHDFMDTTTRNMYRGLAAFLHTTQERRDLLLAQRPPRFDLIADRDTAQPKDDFERIALKAKAAQDYFLLVGPPGTGKTSRALRRMVETFLTEGRQLLIMSYTNRAVDEICKMLSAITPATDFIRIGNELNCDPAYRRHLLENVVDGCRNRQQIQQRVEQCPIFTGTVATLSARPELFRLKNFDTALVDEATQILEPQLLQLLCATRKDGTEALRNFILIGDHKQLPAVVMQPATQSEVRAGTLRDIGLYNLKDSLFERLYRTAARRGDTRAWDMLRTQGRMHEEVACFPNEAFYGGQLSTLGLPHQHGQLRLAPQLVNNEFATLLTRRMAFIPAQPEPLSAPDKTNRSEARITARLAAAIYTQYQAGEGFDPDTTLGIITPYRSQIALIRREIEATNLLPLTRIAVDTVERYQGSERDVIIYSFCVNRLYQLKLLANTYEEDGMTIDRKLNVALTRARKQMFITGVPQILKHNPLYKKLIEAAAHTQ